MICTEYRDIVNYIVNNTVEGIDGMAVQGTLLLSAVRWFSIPFHPIRGGGEGGSQPLRGI